MANINECYLCVWDYQAPSTTPSGLYAIYRYWCPLYDTAEGIYVSGWLKETAPSGVTVPDAIVTINHNDELFDNTIVSWKEIAWFGSGNVTLSEETHTNCALIVVGDVQPEPEPESECGIGAIMHVWGDKDNFNSALGYTVYQYTGKTSYYAASKIYIWQAIAVGKEPIIANELGDPQTENETFVPAAMALALAGEHYQKVVEQLTAGAPNYNFIYTNSLSPTLNTCTAYRLSTVIESPADQQEFFLRQAKKYSNLCKVVDAQIPGKNNFYKENTFNITGFGPLRDNMIEYEGGTGVRTGYKDKLGGDILQSLPLNYWELAGAEIKNLNVNVPLVDNAYYTKNISFTLKPGYSPKFHELITLLPYTDEYVVASLTGDQQSYGMDITVGDYTSVWHLYFETNSLCVKEMRAYSYDDTWSGRKKNPNYEKVTRFSWLSEVEWRQKEGADNIDTVTFDLFEHVKPHRIIACLQGAGGAGGTPYGVWRANGHGGGAGATACIVLNLDLLDTSDKYYKLIVGIGGKGRYYYEYTDGGDGRPTYIEASWDPNLRIIAGGGQGGEVGESHKYGTGGKVLLPFLQNYDELQWCTNASGFKRLRNDLNDEAAESIIRNVTDYSIYNTTMCWLLPYYVKSASTISVSNSFYNNQLLGHPTGIMHNHRWPAAAENDFNFTYNIQVFGRCGGADGSDNGKSMPSITWFPTRVNPFSTPKRDRLITDFHMGGPTGGKQSVVDEEDGEIYEGAAGGGGASCFGDGGRAGYAPGHQEGQHGQGYGSGGGGGRRAAMVRHQGGGDGAVGLIKLFY